MNLNHILEAFDHLREVRHSFRPFWSVSEFEPWVSLQGARLQKVLRFRAFLSHLNFDRFDLNLYNLGAFLNLSLGYLYKEHGFRKFSVSVRFCHILISTVSTLTSTILERL